MNGILIAPKDYEVLIGINEGTGDNLLKEDIEEGYVDYLNYYVYTVEDGVIEEDDGGMIMYKKPLTEIHESMKCFVPDVLRDVFDDEYLEYEIIMG